MMMCARRSVWTMPSSRRKCGDRMKEDDIRIGQKVVCLPRVLGGLWINSEWYGKPGRIRDVSHTMKNPLYKVTFDDPGIDPYWAKANELERITE